MKLYKDDEDMIYDLKDHRYIITPEYIAREYGIQLSDVLNSDGDIDPDTLPERFLKRVSLYIYEYIRSWGIQDPEYKMYEVSKDKYRDAIKQAAGEMAYGWLLNNTDPSVFFQASAHNLIKTIPAVHNILITSGALYRGRYEFKDQDWKERKGIDW